MKLAVILNGLSLKKPHFYKNTIPALERYFAVEVFETRSKNDAIGLAAKAVAKKFDVIVSAGGDGTLHQVINGMLTDVGDMERLPALAVLPLGSGNDFARTLYVTPADIDIVEILREFKTVSCDVGELTYSVSPPSTGVAVMKASRYFLNVVDVGMGPVVVRKVLESGRGLGSAVAYYKSIVSTFFHYIPTRLSARTPYWTWTDLVRTLAVANGRYYGNGLCIAPEAKVDDSRLNVFACGNVSVLDFIIQSLPLKAGRKVRHRSVKYFECQRVDISSDDPLEIEADGEILGWLPATVKVSPIKLNVLRG